MEITIIGSSHPGFSLPIEEAKLFAGHSAGICYMADDFDAILNEPEEKTLKRFQGTVGSGHHSVAGHISYNLLLTGVPKIIAMVLNNEKDYNTSEKSARYTRMQIDGEEKRLYEKWLKLFSNLIAAKYPKLDERTRTKLAQENARYFISVFTPSTTMEYTVDLRQGNYLIRFLNDAVLKLDQNHLVPKEFAMQLKSYLAQTAEQLTRVIGVQGLKDNKGRELSLFAKRVRKEFFSETYSVNYEGSFAELAQAQRHRTLNYEMIVPSVRESAFFVPPIIEDEYLMNEYLDDMESVSENYPQGMLVQINERGTPEDFLMKCGERLCGAAQLEICLQTRDTLKRYASEATKTGQHELRHELEPYLGKTKCQFGFYTCDRPCPLGAKNAFKRKI